MPRPILHVIGPSIAYVQLTKGFWSLIEIDDAELVGRWNWIANTDPSRKPYAARFGQKLHRVLCPEVAVVDHINGNSLDNRRHNLRSATLSQNAWNMRVRVDNISGHKGVYRRNNRWTAKIKVDGKAFHLGGYATFDEASQAYREAAHRYHGEYAKF